MSNSNGGRSGPRGKPSYHNPVGHPGGPNSGSPGTYVNTSHGGKLKYIRVCSGPQRDQYVHTLVLEAKLGRKLGPDETTEHKDGNGLNNDPANLIAVTRPHNTRLMIERRTREVGEPRESQGSQGGLGEPVAPVEASQVTGEDEALERQRKCDGRALDITFDPKNFE